MAQKPVRIVIGGSELLGFTSMTLRRSKSSLTGSLSFDVFMGWLPKEPIIPGAATGSDVLVYIGGNIAFTGTLDRRKDKGSFAGSTVGSLNAGPNSYKITFSARGKTKALIDSSHQHETGTEIEPTNRTMVDILTEPWGVAVDWVSEEIDLNRFRMRDGGRVVDELQRLSEQCSLYMYETRQGGLKVTDGPTEETGDPIVLGKNILSFSTDQAEDVQRSEVVVKGQLTSPGDWGNDAIIDTLERVADTALTAFRPITVRLFGDATEQLISRRNQYEANKRASAAKRVTVDVFHVQQPNGKPWDLGVLHYVEIPPAGVFDVLEVVELTYTVQKDKTLKTSLTLAPSTVKNPTGEVPVTGTMTEDPPMSGAGTSPGTTGSAPSRWGAPSLSPVLNEVAEGAGEILSGVGSSPLPPEIIQ